MGYHQSYQVMTRQSEHKWPGTATRIRLLPEPLAQPLGCCYRNYLAFAMKTSLRTQLAGFKVYVLELLGTRATLLSRLRDMQRLPISCNSAPASKL